MRVRARNAACERLASASKDHTVKVWNVRTGRMLFSLSVRGCKRLPLRRSHSGTRPHTGLVRRAQGHSDSVESVIWGGEGLIYTASRDRTVKVWSADAHNEVRHLPPPSVLDVPSPLQGPHPLLA